MTRPPTRLTESGRRQPVTLSEPGALERALRAAVVQLDAAQQEQERAANRILGLTELLITHAPDDATRLRIEAIMEACAFQDIAGQRLRRVRGLLSRLTTAEAAQAVRVARQPIDPAPRATPDTPPPSAADEGISTGHGGLSQEEVDRLLGRR